LVSLAQNYGLSEKELHEIQRVIEERIRSSHHVFTKDGIEEILNLQPKGAKAKPYQVKQVRNVILKYKLGEKENE